MVYSKHCFAPRKAHTYPIELSVVKNCSKCACGSIAVLGRACVPYQSLQIKLILLSQL